MPSTTHHIPPWKPEPHMQPLRSQDVPRPWYFLSILGPRSRTGIVLISPFDLGYNGGFWTIPTRAPMGYSCHVWHQFYRQRLLSDAISYWLLAMTDKVKLCRTHFTSRPKITEEGRGTTGQGRYKFPPCRLWQRIFRCYVPLLMEGRKGSCGFRHRLGA